MEKISAVYKIVNTVTGDFYVGSSMDVKRRWRQHKWSPTWERHPNSKLYKDMKKYGVDKFRFQILAPVMEEYLKQVEQEFIELLHPTYNSNRANGWDVEREKERKKKYRQTGKYKEYKKKWNQSEKGKESKKKWRQTEKGKEANRKQARKDMKKYSNQLCSYNGETLTLNTLSARFLRAGIPHPVLEAKKYILTQ